MAIIIFQRTATGSFCTLGSVTLEEATELVRNDIKSNLHECSFDSDCFRELDDIPVPEALNFKCFAGPFDFSRKDVEVSSGGSSDCSLVRYEANQNCIYFANGMDLDTAITMASVAAAADDVEQSISIDTSVANRWELSAPEGIPQEVLTRCAPAFIPMSILRKPGKKRVCAVG